jgi:hypothetical protein
MSDSILARVPMVAGLGYIERLRSLPSTVSVTLQVEPDNPYFRHAIAVVAGGEKVGYVAPEVARRYYELVRDTAGQLSCPARRARPSDHETSGVELLLDFTSIPQPAE